MGVLFLDGRTAHALPTDDIPTLAALTIRVLDPSLPDWCAGFAAESWQPAAFSPSRDRFCLAANSSCQVALVADERDGTLAGIWTTEDQVTRHLAVRLVASMTDAPMWPEPREGTVSAGELLAFDLMRAQALHRETPARQHLEHADLYSVLEILKAISAERRSSDILYVFAEGIARVVPMERCSVVRIWGDQRNAHVLASHEDDRVQDLTIDLGLYPEIRHVLRDGHKVVINNVAESPLMQSVRDQLISAHITSIAVVPIVMHDSEVGTLLLRAARRDRPFSTQDVGFFEIVTQAASNALERAHLLDNLHLANEHLERLAITDGLTGLHNHRHFIERLDLEVQRSKRYEAPLACVFMDIDNFKAFNDQHGHLIGDAVLREAAQRISEVMRKVDTVARYGGEEFTLILPQTDGPGAVAKAEMVRALIADRPFACVNGGVTVTVSVGVAEYCPESMEDHLALCRAADRALYISKRNGKNRVTLGGANP